MQYHNLELPIFDFVHKKSLEHWFKALMFP
jgi:hypothetical protein